MSKHNSPVPTDADLANSRAIATAPATLPGMAPELPFLPAEFNPAKARRLSDVSRPQEANITKEKLMEWGNLYLVASQLIVTNKPKPGDSAYLFSFRIPGHPGVWSEFFGMGEQREALHREMMADPQTPIGPMWLECRATNAGNSFYLFTENAPTTVQSVTVQPAIDQDEIPF